MDKRTLIPRKAVEIQGNVVYSESKQAWNTLIFRREFLNEFPQLKEKRSKFSYQLLFYRSAEDFEKLIKEFKKNKVDIMPVLMWIYKEG